MKQSEILESNVFQGLNLGEAMEGIFSIVTANFLATGKATLSDVEKTRKKVISGKELVIFDNNLDSNHVTVKLLLNLKTSSLLSVFGPKSEPELPETLDRRTRLLITSFEQTSAYKRIKELRDSFIVRGKADSITFNVIADGASGEASGGQIKGDIIVRIVAKNKANKTITLPFSIKSDSTTVSNLSPVTGMLKFANMFHLSKGLLDDLQKFKNNYKTYQGEDKKALIEKLFLRMIKEVTNMSFTEKLKNDVFDLLQKEIFGDDLADVIDITNTSIKEITMANFDELRKNTEIQAISTVRTGPPVLQFFRKPETGSLSLNDMIFQLRTKIRQSASSGSWEFKFYVEVGKVLYIAKKAKLETELDKAETKADKGNKKAEKNVGKIKSELETITPEKVYAAKNKEVKRKQDITKSKEVKRNDKRLSGKAKKGDRTKKK